jgi:hypothetical protein
MCFYADVEGGEDAMQGTKYDLVANIVRDGAIDNGKYRVHILNKGTSSRACACHPRPVDLLYSPANNRNAGTGNWFEMEDLIQSEVLPQVITLSESYLQV